MKLLVFGDVYGRIGRAGLKKELPGLMEKYKPDFVIANIENATSGRGAIEKHAVELEKLGIDIMTSGDHVFDNYDKIKDYLAKPNSKLLRCANFYDEEITGVGDRIFEKNGKKLLMIHLQGEVFMNHRVENPFKKVDEILAKYDENDYDAVIVDFHKEATAEGYGFAYHVDGRASFVFGTHTHIQTNDEIILPKGTGFVCDVGMNGALYSVIGADPKSVEKRFLSGINKGKITQSLDENYVVSGAFVEINDDKKCENIQLIRIRGK